MAKRTEKQKRLKEVQEAFRAWRAKPGGHFQVIPEVPWALAVALLDDHSSESVSRTLRICRESPEGRARAKGVARPTRRKQRSPAPSFVEVNVERVINAEPLPSTSQVKSGNRSIHAASLPGMGQVNLTVRRTDGSEMMFHGLQLDGAAAGHLIADFIGVH